MKKEDKDIDVQLKESVLMAREVDLSGEFIYAGLEKFNSMKSLDEPSESFFVLYHLAVGVERLQKVLIVLLEDVRPQEIDSFLETIKKHNHRELATMIKRYIKIDFSKEQNAFLNMLADFYENHRYDKYNYYSYDLRKLNDLSEYLKKNYNDYNSSYSELSERYLINCDIKEFIGRIVGRIGQKYYGAIRDTSIKRNIFPYELRVDSPAYKIFMTNDSKLSYQKELDKDENAVKELLVYLMNTKADNAFLNFMRQIEPLDFDPALVEDFVLHLCKKRVLTDLVDEVDYQYYEADLFSKEKLKERKEMLGIVANDSVRLSFSDYDDDVSN